MTKQATADLGVVEHPAPDLGAETQIPVTVTTGETTIPDPDLDAGIKHLRATDSGAMRIWTVKGPKEVGGTISAVFLADASKVVLLHQLASGKFGIMAQAVEADERR